MAEHTVIKPEDISRLGVTAFEQELVIPQAFLRETFDNYKGKKDDTVNVVVPGVLNWEVKDFRFDRSTDSGLNYDTYSERTYPVKLGQWGIQATGLNAEQADFDFQSWTKLAPLQGQAIGRGVNAEATKYAAQDSIYDITIGVDESALDAGLVRTRKVFRKCFVDDDILTAFVGSDWEEALALDDRLNLAQNVGDNLAQSAFTSNSLGTRRRFNFVAASGLAADEMIVVSHGAFVMANAAPSNPGSAPFWSTATDNGVSLAWTRHYNKDEFRDESVMSTWYGFRHISDPLRKVEDDANGLSQIKQTDTEYFVRAMKVTLNGTGAFSDYDGGTSTSELGTFIGVDQADLTVGAAGTGN